MIVTDEMVDTALQGWFGPGFWKPETTGAYTVANLRDQMRAALEAAVAVAPTQPETSHLDCVPAEQVQAMLDGVIETVPTRDRIGRALGLVLAGIEAQDYSTIADAGDGNPIALDEITDAVLALFGLPALDAVSAMVRDDTDRILREGPTQQIEDEPATEATPPRKPTCPRCGSPRWLSVSLDGGWSRRAQCVPCGAYHAPVIGPGWKAKNFRDEDAIHPDYRD